VPSERRPSDEFKVLRTYYRCFAMAPPIEDDYRITDFTTRIQMRPVLLVPGIGNSGPAHWQSLWQVKHPDVGRVISA